MKSNGPFVRPKTLDPGSMWVAVEAVHVSDGAHPDEKVWATEVIDFRSASTERAALGCAETWFDETDQSQDCELTLSVERHDGTIVSHRVRVSVKPRASIVRAFTLHELLACIAVVAVMIALAAPALGRARETARAAACRSTARQLYAVVVAAAEDGTLPPAPLPPRRAIDITDADLTALDLPPRAVVCPSVRGDVPTYALWRHYLTTCTRWAERPELWGRPLIAENETRHRGRRTVVRVDGGVE